MQGGGIAAVTMYTVSKEWSVARCGGTKSGVLQGVERQSCYLTQGTGKGRLVTPAIMMIMIRNDNACMLLNPCL